LVDPRCERVDHPVVAERQDERIAADDASDDEMPRRAHPAPLVWHPSTTMAQVVMQAAGDLANAGTRGIVEEVFERPKHQALVALACCGTEILLALFQDVVELPFRRSGE
jgi:hypothetical protein